MIVVDTSPTTGHLRCWKHTTTPSTESQFRETPNPVVQRPCLHDRVLVHNPVIERGVWAHSIWSQGSQRNSTHPQPKHTDPCKGGAQIFSASPYAVPQRNLTHFQPKHTDTCNGDAQILSGHTRGPVRMEILTNGPSIPDRRRSVDTRLS